MNAICGNAVNMEKSSTFPQSLGRQRRSFTKELRSRPHYHKSFLPVFFLAKKETEIQEEHVGSFTHSLA